MSLRRIPVAVLDQLPPEQRAKAQKVHDMTHRLVDVLNASGADPDVCSAAAFNAYWAVAESYGLTRQAAESMVRIGTQVLVEKSIAKAAPTRGDLH